MRSHLLHRNSAAVSTIVILGLAILASTVLAAISCSPRGPQETDLIRGDSLGYIEYAWAGTDSSKSMRLTISNTTRREWIVRVEPGTRLEASGDNVQSMVVTEGVRVSVHPHEQQTVEVRTACLDISKDTPSMTDAHWHATMSTELGKFIACVNQVVDERKDSVPADQAEDVESGRSGLLQGALWNAQGATQQQWVDFFIHYQGMTGAEALEAAENAEQRLAPVRDRCPLL